MKSLSVAYGHTSMTAFLFYLGQFIYVNVLILSHHKTRGFCQSHCGLAIFTLKKLCILKVFFFLIMEIQIFHHAKII
jgi:hypothetical protein